MSECLIYTVWDLNGLQWYATYRNLTYRCLGRRNECARNNHKLIYIIWFTFCQKYLSPTDNVPLYTLCHIKQDYGKTQESAVGLPLLVISTSPEIINDSKFHENMFSGVYDVKEITDYFETGL